MKQRLSTPVENWPEIDRTLWQEACRPMRFDKRARIAAGWSPRRRRIVCQGYGQWLAWLAKHDSLDPAINPEARVTPERTEAFVRQLQERVAPWSAVMMVQSVQRMLKVMAPDHDWRLLASVTSNLKRLAKPSRDKRPHMVDPRELYELGLELMAEARRRSGMGDYHAATMGRDGLIVALLICAPVRIGNLEAIEIGQHLKADGDDYWLRFEATETKTDREFEAELPPELTPWVNFYLRIHREQLLARGDGEPTRALWISRWGTPMIEHALRDQIRKRTTDAFGKRVWPHLFRAIAATGFVDHAPEYAAQIPDLLGHTNENTSKRHYILSSGTLAHEAVQANRLARRKEAAARLGLKGGKA